MKAFQYHTPQNAEKVNQLPGFGEPTVVYSLDVDDIAVGDILIVTGQFEASNEYSDQNVKLSSSCLLSADKTATKPGGDTAEIVTNTAHNVTPDEHHGEATKCGSWLCTKALSNAFVNMLGWTSNDVNRVLTVEQGCGQLSVLKFRAT